MEYSNLIKIRTITVFVRLEAKDFDEDRLLEAKIQNCATLLQTASNQFSKHYIVQTVRIATNPFPEYLLDNENNFEKQLAKLDKLLDQYNIQFCSVGPGSTAFHIQHMCPKIVASSNKFSCSALVRAADIEIASAAASTILGLANDDDGGLKNFRFCAAASSCKPFIPFFPVAKSSSIYSKQDGDCIDLSMLRFAIGLENGCLAQALLRQTKSVKFIESIFRSGMEQALKPIENIAKEVEQQMVRSSNVVQYMGIDTSLNPSLEMEGSVAKAFELLDEIECFGGTGSLAAAASTTKVLQSLKGITTTGYCGIMLPLLEDRRLAELATPNDTTNNSTSNQSILNSSCEQQISCAAQLSVSQLLNISSVCGVGIDTVPIVHPEIHKLAALILDVTGLADRWNKPLSCRVFPTKGKARTTLTTFDSPYMLNAGLLELD